MQHLISPFFRGQPPRKTTKNINIQYQPQGVPDSVKMLAGFGLLGIVIVGSVVGSQGGIIGTLASFSTGILIGVGMISLVERLITDHNLGHRNDILNHITKLMNEKHGENNKTQG